MPRMSYRLSNLVSLGYGVWLGPVVAGAVLLGGCAAEPATAKKEAPATIEKLAEGLNRLSLTQHAADRLGMETARVQSTSINGQSRLVVPYGAVIYDKNGGVWAYTALEPRVFVRQKLTIEAIEGSTAILTAGPPAGTAVVTVGAAELFGLEFGLGVSREEAAD